MRAVVFDRPGDEGVLRVGRVDPPRPASGELLIQVAAAGVNRADLLQRRGLYPPPRGASELLGLECSGTVLEVGAAGGATTGSDTGWQTGDRVMALLTGGGCAEQVAVPAGAAMRVPASLALEEAAGVPEVFLTAYLNLLVLGRLAAGETVLVHGGSGGVGSAAIQLGREAGARVVVTAGSAERCARCVELGAHRAVDHHEEHLERHLRDAIDGDRYDVVLDCIGGAYLGLHTSVLGREGRLVIIGLMGGSRAELDLGAVLRKHLAVIGSTLRSRPVDEKTRIIEGFEQRFGAALAERRIRPVIDTVLPLDEVGEAHRRLAAGEVFGKIVLSMNST